MNNEIKDLKQTAKQLNKGKKDIQNVKFSKDTLLNKAQVTQIANLFNNIISTSNKEVLEENKIITGMMDSYREARDFYKDMSLKENYSQEQCELMTKKYYEILDKEEKFVLYQLKLRSEERTKKFGLVAVPIAVAGAVALIQGLSKFKK